MSDEQQKHPTWEKFKETMKKAGNWTVNSMVPVVVSLSAGGLGLHVAIAGLASELIKKFSAVNVKMPLTDEEFKQKLIELCKGEGKPIEYLQEKIEGANEDMDPKDVKLVVERIMSPVVYEMNTMLELMRDENVDLREILAGWLEDQSQMTQYSFALSHELQSAIQNEMLNVFQQFDLEPTQILKNLNNIESEMQFELPDIKQDLSEYIKNCKPEDLDEKNFGEILMHLPGDALEQLVKEMEERSAIKEIERRAREEAEPRVKEERPRSEQKDDRSTILTSITPTPKPPEQKPAFQILVKRESKPEFLKDESISEESPIEMDEIAKVKMDDEKRKQEPEKEKEIAKERYEKESETAVPLLSTEISVPQEYDKNVGVEYYDRMNPENIYILKVEISDNVIETVATQENLLTGERFTQKKDKLKVLLDSPKVLVRPLFPGCLVTPQEQWTDFELEKDELIFQITPLVKTEINASIDFLSNQVLVYRINLPAKVDDPRYAKTIAAYGTGISILPKILPWFGIEAGESISILDALPFLGVLFGDMMLNNFIAIFGIGAFLILGVVFFFKKQAKFSKVKFRLEDIANFQSALKKRRK